MERKKAMLIVTIALAFFGIAGCSRSEAAKAEGSEKEKVKITYMASQEWITDSEMELAAQLAAEDGIDTDYMIVPGDQYFNLLTARLNAGECSDIFGFQSSPFDIVSQINVEKNAVDVTAESWVGRVEPLTLKGVSVDSVVYGQPFSDTSRVWAIAYNKKIFEDLGLSIPATYADLKMVCQTILDSGITPIYEPVSDGWHHVLWFPELGPAYERATPGLVDKLNNNEIGFSENATMITVLNQIEEMALLGFWGENYLSDTYNRAPDAIAGGEFAMFIGDQSFAAEVNKVNPSIDVNDIGYFMSPLADNQILNINPYGPARFIYSGSENTEAAKKYLDYMATAENLQYLVDNEDKYNKLPFIGVEDRYPQSIKDFYNRYSDVGPVLQVAVTYLNPQWYDMGKDITSMLISDDMTAERILSNIDKRRDDQARAAKDPGWQ